ncbi:transglutaminase family protein [Patescibacteria group bacterium]|nr:transglutaminase family protein [Patescibacteria group bacterium]MBU1473232.1 transglutaminase family protein [Patescibacteria group bacterium]MBU2459488.1 transglutaminase family protein [Patescibacteria group bacterium]MBU2544147.1 transglutaminase family protein [Patescibacteria group bacterium]
MKETLCKLFLRIVLSVCVFFCFGSPKAYASGEFQANYDVQYAISPKGITIVTQHVTLTNKLSNFYPRQYAIRIDSVKIGNVIAYDDGGVITPVITQDGQKTEIQLTFNTQVIGIDKELRFTLRYENGDVVTKNGSIWEIQIPGITDDSDITQYTVSLNVPPTFGPNAYMTPLPSSGQKWTREQLIHGGISAAYGEKQNYILSLFYHISNPQVIDRAVEIALPSDSPYQKVAIQSITPKPQNIVRDEDGNWLARYALSPMQQLDIKAELAIQIYLRAQEDVPSGNIDTSKYLAPMKYWETTDPRIIELSQSLRTPRQVYNYVVRTLSYDYNRVTQPFERKGALAALSNPDNSLCSEFTDLFIALARASGIPSREVVGYAYTTNTRLRPLSLVEDILHAWPEYYDFDKKLWIPIDPTWANTTGGVNYFDKLDYNHIVFAHRGLSSEYPYPAGYYRRTEKKDKDISVTFSDHSFAIPEPKINVIFQLPNTITAGFASQGTLIVENQTSVSNPGVSIYVESPDVGIMKKFDNQYFPPLSNMAFTINLPALPYTYHKDIAITANVNEQKHSHVVHVQPMYGVVIACVIVLLVTGLFIVVLLKKFPWKKSKKR